MVQIGSVIVAMQEYAAVLTNRGMNHYWDPR